MDERWQMIGVIDQEKRVIYIGTGCHLPDHVVDTASNAGYAIEVSDDVIADTSKTGINLESLKECIHKYALRDEILESPKIKEGSWNNFTKGGNGKKGRRRKFMRKHR